MTFKRFLIHLCILLAFILLVFMGIMWWLRSYTNHNQQLTLPDYIGQQFEGSQKDAKEKSFRLVVNDSVHIVGKKGGEIIEQNPKGGAKVKENRKIYVTVTKEIPDEKSLKSLPQLYGRNYARKKKELSSMKIYTKIRNYEHDLGEPDHILKVWYKGKLVADIKGKRSNVSIEIGDTLEFTLSSRNDAEIEVPNLMCRTVAEAKTILDVNELELGDVKTDGDIENLQSARVVYQYPSAQKGVKITSGDAVHITVTQNGINCN